MGQERLSHELVYKSSTQLERLESTQLEFAITGFHEVSKVWTNTFSYTLVNELEKSC